MDIETECYREKFSHIYIEERAADYPATKKILARFPDAEKIPIGHYMDVFSAHRQASHRQKNSQNLILAVKDGQLLYEGAPVCQNFGNQHFYYTSSLMNCPYDCEYCYLQGMYTCAHLVLFVNLPDIFAEVERLLKSHPVYLCISYDTDLLALEGITGYVKEWLRFTCSHPELTVECRTKSAAFHLLRDEPVSDRFIFAWTLSPDTVANRLEHDTPNLSARLASIKEALAAGCRVRLCFDPILHLPDWEETYRTFFDMVFAFLGALPENPLENGQLFDVSLGVFRIPKEYLGQMRKVRPFSAVVQYPYQTADGICSYETRLAQEMTERLARYLLTYLKKEQIYLWKV